MLKLRLITAAILLPLLLVFIYYAPSNVFMIFVGVFALFAAWEWAGLIPTKQAWQKFIYIFLVAALLVLLYLFFPYSFLLMMLLGALGWIWVSIAIMSMQHRQKPLGFDRPGLRAFFGLLFIATTPVCMMMLSRSSLIICLLIIFAMDTGGYFIGRRWGRRSLAATISPKKTWEGFLGGLVMALIVSVIGSFFLEANMLGRVVVWGIGLLTAIFSVVGDLAVSLVKRQVGVKDSSHLLPGHGGLLDRLDSIAAGLLIWVLSSMLLG